jgi:hypothetical protein
VLILREKTISGGQSARRFSFDGKLWFSRARDSTFRQRRNVIERRRD